jgi:hypothetical protein
VSGAVNAWRGERRLALPGAKPIVIGVTLDHIARVMSATKSDTLEAMNAALATRAPAVLTAALAAVIGAEKAAAVMGKANGAAGLTAIYVALAGALSGLTPEEEDAAKKAAADRENDAQQAAMRLLLGAIGRTSTGSPSATG